ncbi:MAG: VanZ family protein [Clostridia bacterium]|nr:VanZ family protein [Clostridia bacterium]
MGQKTLWLCRSLLILVILLNLFTVFGFSAEDASASTDTSRGISNILAAVLYPDFESLDADAQEAVMIRADSIVRTLAHCVIFLPMAFAGTLLLFSFSLRQIWVAPLFSLLFSLLFALLDEVHQMFVPGRAFQFTDLLYDGIGMLFGCGAGLLIYLLYKKRKTD